MASIRIRQIYDSVVQRLARRAASNNRSLEDEVRHIPESAAGDDVAANRASFLAVADRLRRETEGRPQTLSEVLIREDRDRGHRDCL
ncbi:MAG: hypothetical protein OXM58_10980 [Rhodospirillaceae bacterium]|nr:hypothetical protein [Rhodospirillaceae bacterium]MDE0617775.1 hypothetical protein [Rhodospirillaceae bacterium]